MNESFSPLPVLALFLGLQLLVGCEKQSDAQTEHIDLAAQVQCDREPGCSVTTDGVTVTIMIGPDAHALRPFPVQARLSDNVSVTKISVQFVMVGMQMGANRYRLVRESDGYWRGQVTLPVCVSARSDWVAEFELLAEGRRIRFDAPFKLGK